MKSQIFLKLLALQGRRQWHPTLVLLPGKFHGWRSLVGWSPWGLEESDTTERLPFHVSLSWIGEGNGNPLQCSCLENPRDGGIWWASVYEVAHSWTRLKRLSSSSSSSITGRRKLFYSMIFSNSGPIKLSEMVDQIETWRQEEEQKLKNNYFMVLLLLSKIS